MKCKHVKKENMLTGIDSGRYESYTVIAIMENGKVEYCQKVEDTTTAIKAMTLVIQDCIKKFKHKLHMIRNN